MNRHFIAIALGSIAFATLVQAGAPRMLKRIEDMFMRTDYERARRELAADTASIDENSLDEALLMLARLETDFAAAGSLYRRVMKSESARAAERARLELASMSYAVGEYQGALDLLQTGAGQDSNRDEGEALYFKALCHKQLGQNGRAAAEFSRIRGGRYAAWSLLGRAEIDAQQDRIDEAIDIYEDLQRSQADPIALFKLGECYETIGEQEKALDRYRSLVDRFPRSLEAAKGKEKIQLLMQVRARVREETQTGGGESGGPRAKEATTGRGFTIQFGSFSTISNALAVSGKLEKILRGVRVESVEMDGRIWHRVRAGFYETREAAEQDVARVNEQVGIAGTVVTLK
jgi:tetratricopeptide (TPR) repeat protein